MEDELLKGNFKVKKPVRSEESNEVKEETLRDEVKKRVLASLGGSMVYVERERLNWDGDE